MSEATESVDGATVDLRVVDQGNVEEVINLTVADSQDQFVAPNVNSLAEAYVSSHAWVRAIYSGDDLVGFIMLSDDHTQPRYYLWRFMIGERFQGQGFGAAAMHELHDYVRTRPGGDRVFLAYVPQEGGPEAFYKALGYVDTGKVHQGEVEAVLIFGDENGQR